MIDERFVILAVILILFGDFAYLVDTIKGKVKPNKVSWLLWGLAPLIAFVAQLSQGVGLLSLTTFAFGGLPLLIFFVSFLNKKAYWKITKFDLICGALAIVGLVLWKVTQVGNWAILFAVASDGLASVPTLIKSYSAPETESYQVYLFNAIGAVITLFIIRQWDFVHSGFPIYISLLGFTLFILIKFKLGRLIKLS